METKKFKAGDLVKAVRPVRKNKNERRIGNTPKGYLSLFPGGVSIQIFYNTVYEVTGNTKTELVNNEAQPMPTIDKEFVNSELYNKFFTAVKQND